MPNRSSVRADFAPPHCPNPECDSHSDSTGWRFKRAGFFRRQARPHLIQRYRCSHCKRAFSSQTFSPTYWLRRPDLLEPVFRAEVAGSGHRQIARQFGVVHATIQRLADRLGRHCLLLHETFRKPAQAKLGEEAVVMDGLGTFAGGQYWPLELTGLVGTRSYYSHDFVVTERRRAGTMTELQKKRRTAYEEKLGRPDPKALTRDVQELLRTNLPTKGRVELRTDEKSEYRTALKRLQHPEIEHETTHSKAPRTAKNPLFAINAHHMFMRHSGANHKRETVAFSKRIQAVIHRHAIFQVWRNLVKAASERQPTKTPAQRLGITDAPWSVGRILEKRLFPHQIEYPVRVVRSYRGEYVSRFVRNERSGRHRFAI
jgi:transposase-like protein